MRFPGRIGALEAASDPAWGGCAEQRQVKRRGPPGSRRRGRRRAPPAREGCGARGRGQSRISGLPPETEPAQPAAASDAASIPSTGRGAGGVFAGPQAPTADQPAGWNDDLAVSAGRPALDAPHCRPGFHAGDPVLALLPAPSAQLLALGQVPLSAVSCSPAPIPSSFQGTGWGAAWRW